MATVTGMTAAAMQALRDGVVIDASIDSAGHIIFEKYDGSLIDAGPYRDATDTVKGVVELATNAEVLAGTDTTRAVTPAGLASIPGNKVQILSTNALPESAVPSQYPNGISVMSLTSGSGWTVNGTALGFVVTTVASSSTRASQEFYSAGGGTVPLQIWSRSYHNTTGGGGWTAWQQTMSLMNLTPTSAVQTTAFTAYPRGWTRIYYTSTNSNGWDFNGSYGEVLTYTDGSDFAHQTWTKHSNGGSLYGQKWYRTANAASGWSPWFVIVDDTGWQTLTTPANGHTIKTTCAWRKKNGVLYLKGQLGIPFSGNSNYTTAFTLPADARPAENMTFAASSNSPIAMSIQVASTGTIGTWCESSTTAWLSLSGISYPLG